MSELEQKFREKLNSFDNFVDIIRTLRGPDGCPWDKAQTHQSLSRYTLEEAFELTEALQKMDYNHIAEELGDVMLQVVLHAVIAEQEKNFTIENVISSIADKMLRRHPHVFADTKVDSAEEVSDHWQTLKDKEKKSSKKNNFDLPKALPSLLKAQKIGEKTTKAKFDWSTTHQVLAKVEEEMGELKEAIESGQMNEQEHELGDVLFSVSQLGRHLGLDSEGSLQKANQRFERRFFSMLAGQSFTDFAKLSDEKKEELWAKVKQQERQQSDEREE